KKEENSESEKAEINEEEEVQEESTSDKTKEKKKRKKKEKKKKKRQNMEGSGTRVSSKRKATNQSSVKAISIHLNIVNPTIEASIFCDICLWAIHDSLHHHPQSDITSSCNRNSNLSLETVSHDRSTNDTPSRNSDTCHRNALKYTMARFPCISHKAGVGNKSPSC